MPHDWREFVMNYSPSVDDGKGRICTYQSNRSNRTRRISCEMRSLPNLGSRFEVGRRKKKCSTLDIVADSSVGGVELECQQADVPLSLRHHR